MSIYNIAFWALTYGILVGGCFAFFSWFSTKNDTLHNLFNTLAPLQILVGIFCFVGGILAIYNPVGEPMFTGDLIPAVIAIVLGFMLTMTYMKTKPAFLDNLNQKLLPYQAPLGILAIGAALVHYFLWGAKNFF